MGARIIDGKLVATELRAEITKQVAELKARTGIVPGLGVTLVGANPASLSYVAAKEKACAEAGALNLTADKMREIERLLPVGFAAGERYAPANWVGVQRY